MSYIIVKPLIITQGINKVSILSVTQLVYSWFKAQVSRIGMLLRWIKVESGYELQFLLETCWQERRTFGGSEIFQDFWEVVRLMCTQKVKQQVFKSRLKRASRGPLYRVESWTVFSHCE